MNGIQLHIWNIHWESMKGYVSSADQKGWEPLLYALAFGSVLVSLHQHAMAQLPGTQPALVSRTQSPGTQ